MRGANMKRARRWAPLIESRDHESIWKTKKACRRSRRTWEVLHGNCGNCDRAHLRAWFEDAAHDEGGRGVFTCDGPKFGTLCDREHEHWRSAGRICACMSKRTELNAACAAVRKGCPVSNRDRGAIRMCGSNRPPEPKFRNGVMALMGGPLPVPVLEQSPLLYSNSLLGGVATKTNFDDP